MAPGPLLEGRRAVVTGGGGGIGLAVVKLFREHGAHVVAAEVDAGRAADCPADTVVTCDVTTRDGVAALVDAAGADVDVLVNNVGHYLFARHDFIESTEEEWEALYGVNLLHVFRCTRALLPGMAARGRVSVVSISTVEAFRGIPQHAVYSAFKAGITAFTRSLALEVGNAGVRVNAVAPDLTETLQVPYSKWVSPEQEALIPT